MRNYLIRRAGLALLLLWLVATILFFFVHLLPGDPADVILGSSDQYQPTQEQLETARRELGLDRPIWEQYLTYLGKLVRGDLGVSFLNKRPVGADLSIRLVRTLQLVIPSMLLSSLLGIAMGVAAARLRGRVLDAGISTIALIGFSIPVFVIGNLMVLVLAIYLNWLPSSGFAELSANPMKWLSYAAMPIIALSLGPLASTMRMTRTTVIEQLSQDYVRTARSKGLPERVVVYKHVLKNALLPVVTVIGLQVGTMFAGSVLVEYVFNWPGLSSLLIRSIGTRDYPVIQGTVMLSSFIFVGVNLLTDLSYAFLNPRLRYS